VDDNLSPWNVWTNLSKAIAKLQGWDSPMLECNWPGRSPGYGSSWFEPSTKICAAHNMEGFESELELISRPCILVIGITEKANISETLFPLTKDYYHKSIFNQIIFTEPVSGRNRPVDADLLEQTICHNQETPSSVIRNPIDAIVKASKAALEEEVDLVIMGSVYLVGDILNHIIIRDNLDLWEELRVHR